MSWKLGQAKQHLSTVVRQAAQEPQIITNRERAVVAVVGAEDFQKFLLWKRTQAQGSMAEALAEARRICAEEEFSLVVPPRIDRPNPWWGGRMHLLDTNVIAQVLPVTPEIARRCAAFRAQFRAGGKARTQADMLIAATASEHDSILVTRNERDFTGCGLRVLNPFGLG